MATLYNPFATPRGLPFESARSNLERMTRHFQINAQIVPFVLIVAFGDLLRAQPSLTTLTIGIENVVEYQVDTSDLSKWGADPNPTTGKIAMGMGVGCVGVPVMGYGDIVSVNGEPARGTYVIQAVSV